MRFSLVESNSSRDRVRQIRSCNDDGSSNRHEVRRRRVFSRQAPAGPINCDSRRDRALIVMNQKSFLLVVLFVVACAAPWTFSDYFNRHEPRCSGGPAPRLKKMDPQKRGQFESRCRLTLPRVKTHYFLGSTICAFAFRSSGPRSAPVVRQGIYIIPTHFTNPSQTDAVFFKRHRHFRLARSIAPLLVKGTVRLPTEDEWRRYWRVCPFKEIEEPVFVVSSTKGDILISLVPGKETSVTPFCFLRR